MKNIKGQAVIEIATFGAIVIFLIGIILRTHLGSSQNVDHEARALKLALQISNQNSQGIGMPANSSRNSASVLFIEDRLSPDFNKFNTIDRSALVASGSGGMSNRLEYPIDFVSYGNEPFGEVGYNLPVMDVFVNGQHFPLTTAAYVFRVLYTSGDVCPDDIMGGPTGRTCRVDADCGSSDGCINSMCQQRGPEYMRCLRQQHETDSSGNHLFYGMEVNGTAQYNPTASNATFDLLRNNWHTSDANRFVDDVPGCPGGALICKGFTWQWRSKAATASSFTADMPDPVTDLVLSLGGGDNPNYPPADTSGSLREQTIYAVSQKTAAQLAFLKNDARLLPYEINGNPHLLSLTQGLISYGRTIGYNFAKDPLLPNPNPLGLTRGPKIADGPITGVVVLDSQLGDMDQTYDAKTSPGPQPGLMQEMEMYSQVRQGAPGTPGTYLQIKEGKLYNPETDQVVRSISSKNHVDLISRDFQLSNNTGRFCQIKCPPPASSWTDSCYVRPAKLVDQANETNPVEVCSDDCMGTYISNTCYSPKSRILHIRTHVGDVNSRKWFTDVTKGL